MPAPASAAIHDPPPNQDRAANKHAGKSHPFQSREHLGSQRLHQVTRHVPAAEQHHKDPFHRQWMEGAQIGLSYYFLAAVEAFASNPGIEGA